MTAGLILKAAIGALLVVLIHFLSLSRNYFVAGLVPLFPTFAIVAHIIIGNSRPTADLKETILFGCLAVIPYLAYLLSLYFLVDRFQLYTSILIATIFWAIASSILYSVWISSQ